MTDPDLDQDLRYFQSIAWTLRLLAHPDYVAIPTPSRKPKKSTEDAIFAETLNTKDTVRAWLALRKKPTSDEALITEMRFLLSLGYAVNGYPNLVHGGMIGMIMDEAMGTLLQLNEHAGDRDVKSAFTAYLKTTYLKPIPTPSVLMATVRLKEIQGRKIFIGAVLEDENGEAMAIGDALWIQAKQSWAKL